MGVGGGVTVLSLPQDTPQAVGAATARCTDLPCGLRCELEVAGESSSRGQEVGPVLRTPSRCSDRRGQDHSCPCLGHRPHVVDENQCLRSEPRNVKVGGGALVPGRRRCGGLD